MESSPQSGSSGQIVRSGPGPAGHRSKSKDASLIFHTSCLSIVDLVSTGFKMRASILTALPLLALALGAATPKRQLLGIWDEVTSLLQPLLENGDIDLAGPFAPVTTEILKDYIEPVNVSHESVYSA